MFNVAAVLIDIKLLDVEFAYLVDCFIGLGDVKGEVAGVGHFWVVMDGEASIGVIIFWFIGGPEFCFIKKDPGPSCLGSAREDAGEFLQIGGDSLARCSDFFTGGHGTDSN